MPDILPDSRMQDRRQFVPGPGGNWVPIFCANCHREGGLVPEENMSFAFWLCNPCFAKCGELTIGLVMPDQVFWEEVKQAQLAKYGHIPTADEVIVSLADTGSLESLLVRSRDAMTPGAGS